jgi:hypothetical protein
VPDSLFVWFRLEFEQRQEFHDVTMPIPPVLPGFRLVRADLVDVSIAQIAVLRAGLDIGHAADHAFIRL